jgi:hypothetical protein
VDDAKEQWIVEVEKWFMTSLLSGILTIQNGALYALQDFPSTFSDEYLREWKLCSRILFRSSDFTNIHYYGFWITIVVTTIIVILGALVDMFPDHLEHGSKKVYIVFLGVLSFVKELPASVRNKKQLATRAGRFWNPLLIFNTLSRVRPRYNRRPRSDSAFPLAEMDGPDNPPINLEEDSSIVEVNSEIDNPI